MNDTVVARPVLDGARVQNMGAFDGFVRSGTVIEQKAFTGATGDQGGYAIPKEIDAQIDAVLKNASPIRASPMWCRSGRRGIASW